MSITEKITKNIEKVRSTYTAIKDINTVTNNYEASLSEKNNRIKRLTDNNKELAMSLYNEKLRLGSTLESYKSALDKHKESLAKYKARQKKIYDNKVNHGFNTTDKYQEVRYMLEEVAELMRAIERDDKDNIKEELSDIIIFAYGLAEISGVGDLDTEIFNKMEVNKNRRYKVDANGDFVKDNEVDADV